MATKKDVKMMDTAEDIIDMYYPHGNCPEMVREIASVAFDAGIEVGKAKK